MPRPDEGLIHEWLDGELPPQESDRVSRLVATDPEWAAAAAEARGLIAASSRILSALDAVPGDVIPAGSRAAPHATSRSMVRPWMRIAAGLVLVAGTGYLVMDQAGNPAERMQRAREQATIGPAAEVATVPPSPAAGAVPRISAAPTPTISEPRDGGPPTEDVVVTTAPPLAVPSAAPAAASTAGAPQPPRQALERRAGVDAGAAASSAAGTVGGLDARRDEMARSRQAAAEREAPPPAALADRAADAPARVPARAEFSARSAAVRNEVAGASGFAAKTLGARSLEGCWLTATTAGADSVLVTPAILRSRGDTLELVAGPVARPASVVREADDLRGSMTDATGRRVTFRATRTSCPAPPPTDDATPSPR